MLKKVQVHREMVKAIEYREEENDDVMNLIKTETNEEEKINKTQENERDPSNDGEKILFGGDAKDATSDQGNLLRSSREKHVRS